MTPSVAQPRDERAERVYNFGMTDFGTAPLSPLAHRIIDAGNYDRLVVAGGPPPTARGLLGGVTPDQLLAVPVAAADAARAMLAGLWLWHDALDESHSISQYLATPAGSFWHAILHRREGDFWNAKYWYARCRNHPALQVIAAEAAAVEGAPTFRRGGGWDAEAFVDWVEKIHDQPGSADYRAAVELQKLEWRALLADCARAAVGKVSADRQGD